MEKELIKILSKKPFYELRLEKWWHGENDNKTEMVAAYNLQGHYIGTKEDAEYLCDKRGIRPESFSANSVCSIGFNESEQKWYGWSHRATFGFNIGHITKEGDCQTTSGYTDEYVKDHPEELEKLIPIGFECKDLGDCKKVAIAFARSVS